MASKQIVRAVDVGYGNTKFIVDENGGCRLFPSLAPRADVHRECGGLYRQRQTTEVWVDGKPYEVGPDSTLFPEIPVLHADYIETPEYRALLFGALDAMQLQRIDLLVTGLPVHLHASRSQRLQQILTGAHTIRPEVTIDVREVAVVSQPLGGFFAHSRRDGNWTIASDRTYLLVDPGYVTFDWLVTRGMQELPGLSGSVQSGVSECLRQVERALNENLGDAYTNLRRIDDGLRCGSFRLRGKTIDLEPYRVHADAVVEHALRALKNRVGIGHEIDEIVLVGGGAPFFQAGLRKAFPNYPLQIVEDSIFANVRGFQAIGEILQQRKSKAPAKKVAHAG